MTRNDDFDPDDDDLDETEQRGALLEMDDLPAKKPRGSSNNARGGNAQMTTRVERRQGGPEGSPQRVVDVRATSEPVFVGALEGPIANVKIALGRTVNLGNFMFARIDIALSMPCRPDAVEQQYERTLGFVDDRLTAEIARARRGGQ